MYVKIGYSSACAIRKGAANIANKLALSSSPVSCAHLCKHNLTVIQVMAELVTKTIINCQINVSQQLKCGIM